jgi:hypothetical protein
LGEAGSDLSKRALVMVVAWAALEGLRSMRSSSLANEELMRSMRSSRLQWGCARAPSWTAAAPQPLTPRVHAMLVCDRGCVRGRGDLDGGISIGSRRGDLDLERETGIGRARGICDDGSVA